MAPTSYNLTLHHLAPEAKAAGLQYPDLEVPGVSVEKIRTLLVALSKAGAKLAPDDLSSPEIRIKTAREVLRVRPSAGGLRLVSWDTKIGGSDFSVDQVIEHLDGPRPEASAATRQSASPMPSSRLPRWAKIAALAVAIIAINVTTLWFLLRAPPTLLPEYDLLPDTDAQKLLLAAAGEYETGGHEGDRRLIIQPDGSMILSTYGAKRKIIEEVTLRSRGARTSGRPALLTSDPYLLEVKDANTVILYGNAYRRRQS